MNFENSFGVDAPIDEVFAALMDIERVAPCMPGAEVLERVGDNAYKVGVRVKVGPISMMYRGQVEIVERDDGSHEATMQVKAREARGQGTADAKVHMALNQENGATEARMVTDLALSGRAASMGRGVIGDVAGKLIEEFAGNLAEMLRAEPRAPATAPAAAAEPTPQAAPQPTATASPATVTAPPAAPASSRSTSLPVGKLAASVIAGRLSNPRTLLITTVVFAVIFIAIGFAIGRAT
jgi:carbon monoxide dehydrogenase subunit G